MNGGTDASAERGIADSCLDSYITEETCDSATVAPPQTKGNPSVSVLLKSTTLSELDNTGQYNGKELIVVKEHEIEDDYSATNGNDTEELDIIEQDISIDSDFISDDEQDSARSADESGGSETKHSGEKLQSKNTTEVRNIVENADNAIGVSKQTSVKTSKMNSTTGSPINSVLGAKSNMRDDLPKDDTFKGSKVIMLDADAIKRIKGEKQIRSLLGEFENASGKKPTMNGTEKKPDAVKVVQLTQVNLSKKTVNATPNMKSILPKSMQKELPKGFADAARESTELVKAPTESLQGSVELANRSIESDTVSAEPATEPGNPPTVIVLESTEPVRLSPEPVRELVEPTKGSNDLVKKNFEILRNRLLESGIQPLDPSRNKENQLSSRKELDEESAAVAKARSEYKKYRNLLIQTAVCPQLPIFKPRSSYTGPTYSCEECKDTFSYPDSLKNHKNRRCVLFTYACPQCKTTLEFYNRCTFFLHVRSHEAAVKACHLTISTIPADKLNFQLLQNEDDDQLNFSDNRPPRIKYRSTKRDSDPTETTNKTTADKESSTVVSQHVTKPPKKATTPNRNDSKPSSDDDDSDAGTLNVSSSDEHDDASNRKTSETPVSDGRRKSSDSELKRHLVTTEKNKQKYVKRPEDDTPQPEPQVTPIVTISSVQKPPPPTSKPVIIRTKPNANNLSVSRFQANLEKPVDEITLTSSDEDEEEDKEPEQPEGRERVGCRDCRLEVPNLTQHYRASNRPQKEFPCEQCKFFSPSACALAAHCRMHTKAHPLICPDCGFYFSNLETFQTHIKQVCFYDFKTIRFQCPECSALKISVAQFIEHLKLCHCRNVYKCSLCITSSYSPTVVEQHMKRKHEDYETGSILEGERCMLCPNILIPKKSIDSHINKHVLSLEHLRYVYICKACNKYACRSMKKFVQHMELCPKRALVFANKVKPPMPQPEKPPAAPPKPKPPKSKPGPRKDSTVTQNGERHAPKAKICLMCQTGDMDEQSKSPFCTACVRNVNAEDTGSEEVRPDGRPKRKFKCKLCKMLMNRDWITITQHYQEQHSANLSGVNSRGERNKTPRDPDAKKTETSNAVAKKRKMSTEENTPAKIQKLVVEEKPVEPCKYKCIKCGFSANAREEFHAHINSHKLQANIDFQCLECGECFIVKPSLEKHLIVVHKMRDVHSYFVENGLEHEEDLEENQCIVCYMKCGTKANYDRHIRTHGMAFVTLQSRLKEKKNIRD